MMLCKLHSEDSVLLYSSYMSRVFLYVCLSPVPVTQKNMFMAHLGNANKATANVKTSVIVTNSAHPLMVIMKKKNYIQK